MRSANRSLKTPLLRGSPRLLGAPLLLAALWFAASPAHAALVSKAPTSFLPHGGPAPKRGAPHLSVPVHASTPPQHAGTVAPNAKIGAKLPVKPAGLALPNRSAPHASVVAPHAGVLGGPAIGAAKRAGVLQGTGLRRRPTAP